MNLPPDQVPSYYTTSYSTNFLDKRLGKKQQQILAKPKKPVPAIPKVPNSNETSQHRLDNTLGQTTLGLFT